jgi:UDP-N-acetylglucosamine acyltransferase
MIHPTAVIHPGAYVPSSVTVGPFAVIDDGVILGADCVVGPHVHLTGHTTIGAGNRFHAGCVIGGEPQDLKYKGEPTRVRIGDRNVFRECATVNRSATMEGDTVIGSDGFFMANTHVGHNSVVGNHVIMANGSMLAGHVTVEDRVFISGLAGVHQFCRVGSLALMQGGSILTMDLPPFCILKQVNELAGLNVVGLRRAGVTAAERLEVKRIYRLLFRSGKRFSLAVQQAQAIAQSAAARTLAEFAAIPTKRGLCRSRAVLTKDDE